MGMGTSVAEALANAGLDFDVEFRGLRSEDGSPILSHTQVYSDSGKYLGIVGAKAKILSHKRAFEWVDDTLSAHFPSGYKATAYHNNNQSRVSGAPSIEGSRCVLKVETPISIAAGEDDLRLFLFFMNSVDGSSALRALGAIARFACSNLMTFGGAGWIFNVASRHTSGLQDRLENRIIPGIDAALGKALGSGALDHIARLQGKKLNSIEQKRYFSEVLTGDPLPEREPKALGLCELLVEHNLLGTAWGSYNALTAFATHHKGGKNRMFDVLAGPNKRIIDRAWELSYPLVSNS